MGNRWFIVTGTSSGIGKAVAEKLLKRGYRVCGLARSSSALSDQYCHYEHYIIDLKQHDQLTNILEQILSKRNIEDDMVCLLNNAAGLEPLLPIEQCDVASIKNNVDVTLTAPMCLTSAFIHLTREWNLRKKVVNISSGSAIYANPAMSVYSAAKAGLDMFTRCVGKEQERATNPVEIISVHPGMVDTRMQQTARNKTSQEFVLADYFRDTYDTGQLQSVDECADWLMDVIFYSYATGEVIPYQRS